MEPRNFVTPHNHALTIPHHYATTKQSSSSRGSSVKEADATGTDDLKPTVHRLKMRILWQTQSKTTR